MPAEGSSVAMGAPGEVQVNGPEFAANLLDVAIWSLREEGLVAVEQRRPYTVERAGGVMGGSSFCRLAPLDPVAQRPGLEGALIDAAREHAEGRGAAGRMIDRALNRLSGDEEMGLRNVVRLLDIEGSEPWVRAANYCLAEASAAGLAASEGRMSPKPVIIDQSGVEALGPRLEESRAARRAYREREEELDNCVLADSLQALHNSRHTSD